jgi:predicted RNase H-like nuclease (RuvC/YqgF family)
VSTLEERVAFIEGQVSEQSHAMIEVREAVRMLEHRVDGRFEAMDRRFEAMDRRFEAVDRRFDTVDRRIDALDEKLSRYFVWLVGLQVTTLVAIVGALLTRT